MRKFRDTQKKLDDRTSEKYLAYRPNKYDKRGPKDPPGTPRKKKSLGQHFLRKQSVVDHMIERVAITPTTSIMEIGCGDGFLTRSILNQSPCARLWSFEIDKEWFDKVSAEIKDPRLNLILKNILDVDWNELAEHKPWTLLANLPYQITFPILFRLQAHRHLFAEGVIMVQEEVAQKIVATKGRACSAVSLRLQHKFTFELMEKIGPDAFVPPPKVSSRLVYFRPKLQPDMVIPNEEAFWDFLKLCFRLPRQTLRNNLKTTHFSMDNISPDILALRAQQCSIHDFLKLWELLYTQKVDDKKID